MPWGLWLRQTSPSIWGPGIHVDRSARGSTDGQWPSASLKMDQTPGNKPKKGHLGLVDSRNCGRMAKVVLWVTGVRTIIMQGANSIGRDCQMKHEDYRLLSFAWEPPEGNISAFIKIGGAPKIAFPFGLPNKVKRVPSVHDSQHVRARPLSHSPALGHMPKASTSPPSRVQHLARASGHVRSNAGFARNPCLSKRTGSTGTRFCSNLQPYLT